MTLAKIEFAVNMTCQKCVDAVRNSLTGINGIENIDVSLEKGNVVIETNLPASVIQEKIEQSGKKAVLKGYGDNFSAVAMLGGNSGYSINNKIMGVIRFTETSDGCIVDGTVDGLNPGEHGIHIHECGDISKGCDSVGEHFNPNNTVHGGPEDDVHKRHVGDLGNITVDNSGRATFRKIDKLVKIPDIIGRSLVITENPDDLGKGDSPESKINGNSGNRLSCGIIARSSSLFQNTKKICACDGLTLWDERDKTVSNNQKSSYAEQNYK
ncbi:copper chaperone for superoxide dismutase isoform X3 [Hylaeus anthracinus]|uniref:copper chaperone for superoxide dismutase isoform X3 n=1 Tax=Hylaeus volcanicus TaxID=313075 RepID=UPI0023B861DB|nr:copper chaperone for superoxide dismutase isoform X3 [Hylaeus volcanicus]XP_054008988.1 copper chaperone for superoxide dismutase isoform X3 [Hylaeus anthracinus]